MAIYSKKEIEILRDGGKILASILNDVANLIKPGITTAEINEMAEKKIRATGGKPSFLNYRGSGITPFPSTICISINNEVVHGPASPIRSLKEGDIVGLDIGMRYPKEKGLCTDTAVTVGVGKISKEAERLINITKQSLELGIKAARVGGKINDISRAVQTCVEKAGFSVVRDLVGHGVGHSVHEEPEVPNFFIGREIGNYKLIEGLVIAIEPMVNMGRPEVKILNDNWTVVTVDKSLSAHFEHTIVISSNGPEILTRAI